MPWIRIADNPIPDNPIPDREQCLEQLWQITREAIDNPKDTNE